MTISESEAMAMLDTIRRRIEEAGTDMAYIPEIEEWYARHRPPLIHYGCLDPIKRLSASRDGTVVLCGSGPSLTVADLSDHDGITVGVNEAAIAREADFVVIFDPPVMDRVRTALRNQYGDMWQECGPTWLVVENIWMDPAYEWVRPIGYYYRRRDIVDCGSLPGTATICLQLLHQAGFREVKMVGFDGFFRWLRGEPPVLGTAVLSSFVSRMRDADEARKPITEYDRIHASMKALAERHGMVLREVRS